LIQRSLATITQEPNLVNRLAKNEFLQASPLNGEVIDMPISLFAGQKTAFLSPHYLDTEGKAKSGIKKWSILMVSQKFLSLFKNG